MLWFMLVVVVIVWVLVFRWENRHIIKMYKQLKNDLKTIPLLGHGHWFFGNSEDMMRSIQIFGREAIKHGGLTYGWSGPCNFIVVADPDAINVISKTCLEKHYVMRFFEPGLGNGSLIAPVQIWRSRRKVNLKIFPRKNLVQFVAKIFSAQSCIMVDRLRSVDGKGAFAIWKYVTTYTLDSVCESVLGIQLKTQQNSNLPLLKSYEKCVQVLIDRMFKVWLHSSVVFKLSPNYRNNKKHLKVLLDFVDQVVQSKRKQMEMEHEEKTNEHESNAIEDDRLKPLLEDIILESLEGNQLLTDVECREELLTLIFAANDTSAVALSFTAVMLSRHPKVQEMVYQELREVFGDSDRAVKATDLPQLKYLEAVIKETLRLYPPVPLVVRQVDRDIELPSGITIAKGVGTWIHIWAVHRNPRYWGDDAEVFRPERFLDTPLKHPAAFIPFSFGPRNCIGFQYAMMSMTTAMATLLRTYQLLPAATSSDENMGPDISNFNDKPLRLSYDIMMRDVDGFQVQIKSRG